jgi:hypothetical protein
MSDQGADQRWTTIGQAARLLGVSPQTVRNRVAAGQLQGRKGNRGLQVLLTPGPDLEHALATARAELDKALFRVAETETRLALAEQRAALVEAERDRLAAILQARVGPPPVLVSLRRWAARLLGEEKGTGASG